MKRKSKINWNEVALVVGALIFLGWFSYEFVSIARKQKQKYEPPMVSNRITSPFIPMEIKIPVHLKFSTEGGGFKVIAINEARITAYNNLPAQTNSQPNIGASTRKVFVGSCAVSRDILREYKVKYGDILCIKQKEKCYFIEDTMNKRYDGENGKHVDIFMYDTLEALKTNYVSDIVILQQL